MEHKLKFFISHDGSIAELVEKLKSGLFISDFEITNDEYPPYDEIAMTELLGFEVWLKRSNISEGNNFIFEICTQLSHEEIFLGQMHDLSLWLARMISVICGANTLVIVRDGENVTFQQ